jgi:hypothetical protein
MVAERGRPIYRTHGSQRLSLWDAKTQTEFLLLVENFNWLQRSSGLLYTTQTILHKFHSKSLFQF